jgi:hypothetical protein
MDKIVFSSLETKSAVDRAVLCGEYVRLFRGAAVEKGWMEALRPEERVFARCVALAGLHPGIVFTKMSAAVCLGAQIRNEPKDVFFAVARGSGQCPSRLDGVSQGWLPAHSKLTGRAVTISGDGKFVVDKSSVAAAEAMSRSRIKNLNVAIRCTSPASTIFDVAAAYPLEESLIVINSLLTANANKRRILPTEDRRREKGQKCGHLNRYAVTRILTAQSYESFRARVEEYRQHGFTYVYSADMLEECYALVWQNKGRRGVRRVLLALLLASDRCESPGESLACCRFFEMGFVPPYLQISFEDGLTRREVYRVDGAWDLRSASQKRRKPFVREVILSGAAAPGSRQSLLFEFDGQIKYRDERILGDRDKAAVLDAQYKRETALREQGYELVRISWGDLLSSDRLRTALARFSVPRLARNQ